MKNAHTKEKQGENAGVMDYLDISPSPPPPPSDPPSHLLPHPLSFPVTSGKESLY